MFLEETMFGFSCAHPASSLFVKRDSTSEKRDADFIEVTHHLFCMKCGADVDIGYSMLTNTVSEFLQISERKRSAESATLPE